MNKPLALKLAKLVSLGLGLLIIGCLGLLGYGLSGLHQPLPKKEKLIASSSESSFSSEGVVAELQNIVAVLEKSIGLQDGEERQKPKFDPVGLGEPAGSQIVQVDGDDGRILVMIKGGGLPDRVLVVAAATGRILGRIEIGRLGERLSQLAE